MIEDKGKIRTEQAQIEQLKIISNNFTQELHNAQNGEKTSLAFTVHQLSPSPIVSDGEKFLSLVIGGTIGKIATLRKDGQRVKILDKKEEELSIKTGDEFLKFIANHLPEDVDTIALNLAYHLEPVFMDGKLDGILLAVAKEGGFRDLIGKQIGKEIENYILEKRSKEINVGAVANDTVCLLTSGLSKYKPLKLAAGIVGTGLNIAIVLDDNVINLESANFDKFPQTETGKKVDEGSSQPGKALFEKEVAGAYLHKHFNHIKEDASINYTDIGSTEELDKISRMNIPQVSEIAQSLLKHSAQLVACQIAGVAAFKKRNMVFNMEGSLFWKGNNYRQTVERTVRQLTPEYKIDFVEIENSAILGAAKLIS